MLPREFWTKSDGESDYPHDQGPINYNLWATPSLPFVFANKVLLEHNHMYSFMYCIWLLSPYHSGPE